MRGAELERETAETQISVSVELDGEGGLEGGTGISFLDHVLNSLCRHGSIAVEMEVSGDENPHHRTEDAAITLGRALSEAAGQEIERFGDARVPMDEALVDVALDFGGRSYQKLELPEGEVEGLPVDLFEHFIRSFADAAGTTLHLSATGENMHHVVEVAFKGLGVALEEALEPRGEVRSTKEVLD